MVAIMATTTNICSCDKFHEPGFNGVTPTCECLGTTSRRFIEENEDKNKTGVKAIEERATLKLELKNQQCKLLQEKDQDLNYKRLLNLEDIRKMEELECYGAGDFKEDLGSLKCVCDTIDDPDEVDPEKRLQLTKGDYCKECRDGYINWPKCDMKSCEENKCGEGNKCDDKEFQKEFCSFFTYREIRQSVKSVDIINKDPITVNPGEICCSGGTSYDSASKTLLKDIRYKLTKSDVTQGRHCCNNGDNGYCERNEDCVDGKKCVKKGSLSLQDQCEYNGDKKLAPEAVYGPNEKEIVICEEPGQTCCGSTCCNANQICRVIANGYARYDWVSPQDGKTVHEDDRLMCSDKDVFSTPAIIRFALFPALLIIALLVSTALVISTGGMGEITVAGPALIVIVCSLFLVVSQFWAAGLLLSLGSLLAIGAQAAKSENRHVFSVIVQFLIFAAFVGRFGVSSQLIATPAFSLSSTTGPGLSNSYSESWALLRSCSNYYGGTFNQNGSPTQPWYQAHIDFYGVCAYHYQAFLVFMICLAAVFYFIQLVASATLTANK